MKRFFLYLIFVLLAGLLSMCEKSMEESVSLTIAEDEVFMLKSAEVVEMSIESASFGGHLPHSTIRMGKFFRFFPYKHFPDCAVVTISNDGFPKEIVIEYGENCVSRNGMVISGTITITISDSIINEGAILTYSTEGFTIGDKVINSEATLINEGINSQGNWVISSSSITTTTYADGHVITRDFTEQKEWLNGFLTPEHSDDQFYKTGGGTITVDNEIIFTRTITEPLYIDRSCRFILSGIVEIAKNGETMTINFGDGECDNIAIVTKDGVSEEIELHRGQFKNKHSMHHKSCKKQNGWW